MCFVMDQKDIGKNSGLIRRLFFLLEALQSVAIGECETAVAGDACGRSAIAVDPPLDEMGFADEWAGKRYHCSLTIGDNCFRGIE